MLGIHKLNPMVRAVGTMGAIAAIVGGVTFAATGLTSNTVALTNNNMTVSTAVLAIEAGTSCTASSADTQQQGLNGNFAPGGTVSVSFCIQNTGNTNLTITGSIPEDLSGSTVAAATTLDINCTKVGDSGAVALNTWHTTPQVFPGGTLKSGQAANCTATATLSSTFSGGGTVPTFTINFVGNS